MLQTSFSPTSLLPLLGCAATRVLATEVLDAVMYGRVRLNPVRYDDLVDELSKHPSPATQGVVDLVEQAVADDKACSETCQSLFAYLEATPDERKQMGAASELARAAGKLMSRELEEVTPWGKSRQVLHGSASHHVCGVVNCLASERGVRARAALADDMRAIVESSFSGSAALPPTSARRRRNI